MVNVIIRRLASGVLKKPPPEKTSINYASLLRGGYMKNDRSLRA
jgi:hypothetical protein